MIFKPINNKIKPPTRVSTTTMQMIQDMGNVELFEFFETAHNPLSEKSKKMIQDMGNVELVE